MMMIPVIAIYDIGKTNKKLILYDSLYNIAWETQTTLPEGEDDDGYPCENLGQLTEWITTTWNDVIRLKEFRIDALHYTTYGASLVHLDRHGKPVTPLYSYFKPISSEITDTFYNRYGGMLDFSVQTASPAMGMLNSGLQLYWLKQTRPELFSGIKTSLHLPHYCSYLFTGRTGSELTSIGCHTALWDFQKKRYHRWVYDEGIDSLLPPVTNVIKIGDIIRNDTSITAGIGLHDSSAALVPYLQTFRRPFMLMSTGTWCINLFPFATEPLTKHQLERDCLSYLTFRGEAVKASRVFLGGEHDHQVKRLSEHFHCDIETYKTMRCDPVLIEKIASRTVRKDTSLEPATMKGTGPFPDIEPGVWDITAFTSYEEAYHQLIVDMVCIVGVSLYLVNEGKCDVDLFVDGGFGKNEIFMTALASLFPAANVRSSRISQATSLGTAMMMHPYWEGNDLVSEDMFNLKAYSATAADSLQAYYDRNYVRHKKNSL